MTEHLSEVPVTLTLTACRTDVKTWRSACSCRATISLEPWKYGGIVHTTGLLQWVDTGHDGEEVELPLI